MDNLIGYFEFIYQFIKAIRRDMTGAQKLVTLKARIFKFERDNSSVFDIFNKVAEKHPDKKCIIFNDEIWTFKKVIKWIYWYFFLDLFGKNE